MMTQILDASPPPLMKRELTGSIPSTELLDFFKLSIGEKTDAYLRQLALLAAHRGASKTEHPEQPAQTTQTSATTELKNKQSASETTQNPIMGVITAPKSILFPMQWRVGVRFMLQLNAISGPQFRQTKLMARLHISKLNPDTVLFWNWCGEENGTFTLSFSDIQNSFNREPAQLYSQQNFIAEVLAVESSTIKLRLTGKNATD